jgi:hypothetical protein
MSKKFQIFISSTFTDLIGERQDVIKSVLDLGHIPSGMEAFPAADLEQFSYIKKVIDECDYYVLIVAGRYGSIDENGKSYTELEYDYAVSSGKTVLAFVHSSPEALSATQVDTDPVRRDRLNAFRTKISKGRLVKFWKTRESLHADVIISLTTAFREAPAVGWIRGDAAASESLLRQINDLRNTADQLKLENEQLRSALKPAVANLAGMQEKFGIHYMIRGFRADYSGVVALTWSEIFATLGSDLLLRPLTLEAIGLSLAKYLAEVRENPSVSFSGAKFWNSDLKTIKMHLIALNFVELCRDLEDAIQLTDLGKSRLIEVMAVRSQASTRGAD